MTKKNLFLIGIFTLLSYTTTQGMEKKESQEKDLQNTKIIESHREEWSVLKIHELGPSYYSATDRMTSLRKTLISLRKIRNEATFDAFCYHVSYEPEGRNFLLKKANFTIHLNRLLSAIIKQAPRPKIDAIELPERRTGVLLPSVNDDRPVEYFRKLLQQKTDAKQKILEKISALTLEKAQLTKDYAQLGDVLAESTLKEIDYTEQITHLEKTIFELQSRIQRDDAIIQSLENEVEKLATENADLKGLLTKALEN